jgi:hypothetical protein
MITRIKLEIVNHSVSVSELFNIMFIIFFLKITVKVFNLV